MKRRSVLTSLAAAGSLGLLSACGDDTPAGGVSASPSGSGAATGAFPVTITHKFGDTVVEAAPQRVVTIGFNEQDTVLALGVVPVGTRAYSGYAYQQRPWAKDLLPAQPLPEVGDLDGLNLEAIAALTPDLLVGTYSYITDEAQYQKLTAIAPTIGDLEGGTPGSAATWQVQLETIGRALGREDRAAELRTQVEAKFTDAKAAHPEFAGKVVSVVLALPTGYYGLDGTDPRGDFFLQFGFSPAPTTGEIAAENVAVLDTDVLVVLGQTQQQFTATPTAAALPVVTEGRTVFVEDFADDFAGALGFSSPLSLPFAVDLALPQLAAAADGDPATAPRPL